MLCLSFWQLINLRRMVIFMWILCFVFCGTTWIWVLWSSKEHGGTRSHFCFSLCDDYINDALYVVVVYLWWLILICVICYNQQFDFKWKSSTGKWHIMTIYDKIKRKLDRMDYRGSHLLESSINLIILTTFKIFSSHLSNQIWLEKLKRLIILRLKKRYQNCLKPS